MIEGIGIKFQDVSLTLGGNQILENINFEVKKGTIHCIIGPNGGGKSSLIKCILSLLPYEGDILLEYEKEKIIGYVPQNIQFDRTLPITVYDFLNISFSNKPCFLNAKKNIEEVIDNLLIKIGMKDKKYRKIGSLSGGELQRVLLIQALYPKPNLLILDEPLSGIDALGEEYFFKIMQELRSQGVTVLWVHHNLKQIKDMADKVTCIKCGLEFSGNPEIEITKERIFEIFS